MKGLPPPFNALPENTFCHRALMPGDMLFRQGASTHAFYLLTQGTVTLSRWSQSGDQIVIHTAHSGESFAEAALFSEVYHCDAQAKTACSLWQLDKTAVLATFTTNPDFALQLTAKFAGQIQTLRRHQELLAIRSAQERVYAALCEGMLTLDIKHFAASIGLAPETTYRALASLARDKRIVKTARGYYEQANEN